uniref:NAD(P)(+)--arginine ADP-ribosyltransferase n=1 Tax=Myripristis murdjan TaxID=586833 RepID=A0A667YD79_9TELE
FISAFVELYVLLSIAYPVNCSFQNSGIEAARQLDMAPDAVDDLYDGCRDKVLEKVVQSGLLKEELSRNEEFNTAWSRNTKCSKLIPGGLKEHTAALATYANEGQKFRKTFNNAVEAAGNASLYESSFNFKSLHFLLMDSMRLLNNTTCKTVYRASETKYTVQNGSEVRFGRFTAARPDLSAVKEDVYDGGVLFHITSCSLLNMEENICQASEIEQLLSPAEVFKVEDVRDVHDEAEFTEIILKHSRFLSKHNCYLFPRSPSGSSVLQTASIVLV